MALFTKKKDTEAKPAKEAAAVVERQSQANPTTLSHVILHPRITEKATMHGEQGVYTFDVSESANKQQISQAVRALYKVIPRKVRIVNIPSKIKRSARTGKIGVKGGGKKAYVYLKRGDKINLV